MTTIDPKTAERTDVLLVLMPFAHLFKPSLGLTLLKVSLTDAGITARILYYNLIFGRLIGHSDYTDIGEVESYRRSLLGEWIFAAALHGDEDSAETYLNDILCQIDTGNQHSESPQFRHLPKDFLQKSCDIRRAANEFISQCTEDIVRQRPRIVGLSSTFHQHVSSLALARRIKEALPNTAIVFGGSNCEGVMGAETLRQFPFVDVVVSGEGDTIFRDLVERVLSGHSLTHIPGVYVPEELPRRFAAASFENTSVVRDLDKLPYPDYDDYFEQFNASGLMATCDRRPDLLFETSRGCWWGEKSHCTFCGLNGLGMAYRSKSADRALGELLHLVNKYPGLTVEVVDNILDYAYFKDFIPALGDLSLDLNLFYEMKANLRKDQVRMLQRAGIQFVQPGVESLSSDVLRLMRKGVTATQNIQLLKWCKEFDLKPYWNIIWGFPGESPESYRRMAELVPLLTHLHPPLSGGPVHLERFSPLFNQSDTFGFVNVRATRAYSYVYRVTPEHAFNLAYLFDFDYREPQPVHDYTRPLLEQIRAWKSVHETSDLFFGDSGDMLDIWDFRPIAREQHVTLEGEQRLCYLECDHARSAASLATLTGSDSHAIGKSLQPLLDLGLMVNLDDVYLSLAIRLGVYEPKADILQHFWDLAIAPQLSEIEP